MQNFKIAWFMFFIFLVFYVYGAGMVDGFMGYPLFYIAGKSNVWIEYKNAANQLATFPIAGPALLLPIVTLITIWLKPQSVPRIAIIISLLLTCTSEILTVKMMWPIHGELAHAYSDALMDKLMFFDHRIRKGIQTINLAVVFYMLYCSIKKKAVAKV